MVPTIAEVTYHTLMKCAALEAVQGYHLEQHYAEGTGSRHRHFIFGRRHKLKHSLLVYRVFRWRWSDVDAPIEGRRRDRPWCVCQRGHTKIHIYGYIYCTTLYVVN